MPRLIAVAVASSRVGKATIRALLQKITSSPAHHDDKVRAILRDVSRQDPSWKSPALEVFACPDLENDEALRSALFGASKAFIVAPQLENRADIVDQVMTSARHAGVGHVVLIGGVFQEEEKFLFHQQWMSCRRRADELGLAWTQLECSDFMENLLGSASLIRAQRHLVGVFPEGVSSPVAIDDVGSAAAAVLLDFSSTHHKRGYKVVGPETLTPLQVADIISDVTGSKLEFVDIGLEESKRRGLAAGRAPWQVKGFAEWQSIYFKTGRLKAVKTDLPLLGVRPTSLQDWVSQHLIEFLPIRE